VRIDASHCAHKAQRSAVGIALGNHTVSFHPVPAIRPIHAKFGHCPLRHSLHKGSCGQFQSMHVIGMHVSEQFADWPFGIHGHLA